MRLRHPNMGSKSCASRRADEEPAFNSESASPYGLSGSRLEYKRSAARPKAALAVTAYPVARPRRRLVCAGRAPPAAPGAAPSNNDMHDEQHGQDKPGADMQVGCAQPQRLG